MSGTNSIPLAASFDAALQRHKQELYPQIARQRVWLKSPSPPRESRRPPSGSGHLGQRTGKLLEQRRQLWQRRHFSRPRTGQPRQGTGICEPRREDLREWRGLREQRRDPLRQRSGHLWQPRDAMRQQRDDLRHRSGQTGQRRDDLWQPHSQKNQPRGHRRQRRSLNIHRSGDKIHRSGHPNQRSEPLKQRICLKNTKNHQKPASGRELHQLSPIQTPFLQYKFYFCQEPGNPGTTGQKSWIPGFLMELLFWLRLCSAISQLRALLQRFLSRRTRSADLQSAVSPNCIRRSAGCGQVVRFGRGQRIANPRYSRIEFCATVVAAPPSYASAFICFQSIVR